MEAVSEPVVSTGETLEQLRADRAAWRDLAMRRGDSLDRWRNAAMEAGPEHPAVWRAALEDGGNGAPSDFTQEDVDVVEHAAADLEGEYSPLPGEGRHDELLRLRSLAARIAARLPRQGS